MNENKKVDVADSLEDLLGIKPKNQKSETVPKTNSDSNEAFLPAAPGMVSDDNSEVIGNINGGKHIPDASTGRVIPEAYLGDQGLIQCPAGIDHIPITAKAFEDIIMVARAVNELGKEQWGENSEKLEVYMYVLADAEEVLEGQPTPISEIYIPHHTAAETRVNVEQDAMFEVQQYIRENNQILLGWAHSHGHFEVYSSSTDERNHETLLHETSNIFRINHYPLKYIYGITVVESGKRYGVILTQYPCGHIEHRVDKEFTIIGDRYSQKEKQGRYEELKTILEERAQLIQPTEKQSQEEIIQTIGEELTLTFVRNLSKVKNLLFDELPDLSEKEYPLVQKTIEKYENLLMDNTEQSFHTVSEKLLKSLKNYKEDV